MNAKQQQQQQGLHSSLQYHSKKKETSRFSANYFLPLIP
jgi:hypothetical protein